MKGTGQCSFCLGWVKSTNAKICKKGKKLYQDIYECGKRYLQDEIQSDLFDWCKSNKLLTPFCAGCFESAEKIHRTRQELEELQDNLLRLIIIFKEEVKKRISKNANQSQTKQSTKPARSVSYTRHTLQSDVIKNVDANVDSSSTDEWSDFEEVCSIKVENEEYDAGVEDDDCYLNNELDNMDFPENSSGFEVPSEPERQPEQENKSNDEPVVGQLPQVILQEIPRGKRKTTRGVTIERMDAAAKEVLKGRSARSVAMAKNIPFSSLHRFLSKLRDPNLCEPPTVGYRAHNRVFSDKQEIELEEYLLEMEDLFYGLSSKIIRRLAYQSANKKQLQYPDNWDKTELAGKQWLNIFMKRHPKLSARKCEATSVYRATKFKPEDARKFLENLENCLKLHSFKAHAIYNMNETGITTVNKPDRIVAPKEIRQPLTPEESGTVVTVALAVNAVGNTIPPHLVFPNLEFKDDFIRDGPPGCIGTANATGWMEEKDFHTFMQHFQEHVNASLNNKILLIIDYRLSHIVTVNTIDFCKSNGIFLLTFPPHCPDKLQPLGRSVYETLKTLVNTACYEWMLINPGKPMSVYDIPGIVKTSISSSATISNITEGFKCTGIYPFNPSIFQNKYFPPSVVTNWVMDGNQHVHLSGTTVQLPTATLSLEETVHDTLEERNALQEELPVAAKKKKLIS